MAYNAPTQATMSQGIARSLRDPNGVVFSPDIVADFINEAMADLGMYRPKEVREVAGWPLPVQEGDGNLILNGGFEDPTLEGWGNVSANNTSVYDASAPYGTRVLRTTGPDTTWPTVIQTHDVLPGVTYHLEAWASRVSGSLGATVRIDNNIGDTVLALRWLPAGSGPYAWTRQEGWYTVPSDGTVTTLTVVVFPESQTPTPADDWRFDGISLVGEDGMPPPPFTGFNEVWMVQYRAAGYAGGNVRVTTIPPIGHSSMEARWGWSFYDGQVILSDYWNRQMQALYEQGRMVELVVWGYAAHELPASADSVMDLDDSTDALCVITHCKYLGFTLLNHDRSLYQQWIAATNNTDVSPTQLQGMEAAAEQTFERMRSRNTRLRRVAAGDLAFTY